MKTRRAKGTGYLRKEGKKGLYYGYLRTGKTVQRVKLSPNERESKRLWEQYLIGQGHLEPSAVYGKNKTPWNIVEQLVEDKMRLAQESTNNIYSYKMILRWLKDGCGKLYLEDVIADDVAALFQGRGHNLKNRIVSTLKRIYEICGISAKFIEDFPRFHGTVQHHRALSDDEVDRLLAVECREDVHKLIVVGLNSGFRLKDAVYLNKNQIVERNGKNYIHATPFKTRGRSGTECCIPVGEALQSILDGPADSDGFFFPRLKMLHSSKNSMLNWEIRRAFGKAGLAGRSAMFHALRTTFITRLVDKGAPLGFIQTVVGHLDPSTTMVYVRPTPEMLNRWFG